MSQLFSGKDMDFVEGDTLADLLRRGDGRLKDRKFIKKLLLELVDVVEYLHNRNIVHCDIKADNVIVSPYADRPVTLIDLDKARSPWLDSTHGDTAKYGCEECADGAIDFKAIGLLAGKLGLKKFDGNHASAATLRKSLCENRQAVWWIAIASVVILMVVGLLLLLNNKTPEEDDVAPVEEPENVETRYDSVHESKPEAPAVIIQQPAIDTAWISAKIAEKEAVIRAYGQALLATLRCDTISISDKNEAISDYTYKVGVATVDIIYSSVRRFENIDELTVQKAVRSKAGWQRIEAEGKDIQDSINAWRHSVKESRRSSARPASQPDTIPGDGLPAQHR